MTLKVIGAGAGRTGTMSLKLALEQLGFGPCHHMSEIMMHPETIGLWLPAADGRADWEAIFKGYASAVDAPTCIFWRELVTFYPAAKIILTTRDPNAWFDSGQATVLSPMAQQAVAQAGSGSPFVDFMTKVIRPGFGAGAAEHLHDRDFMVAHFNRHNAEVMQQAPKDRLLVYEVRQGWGPLCAFLGVDVPEAPFPRVNTREDISVMMSAARVGQPGVEAAMPSFRNSIEGLLGKS